ncbi:uncharacterized protein LOC144453296 [Glandiceps talaboti]
MESENNRMNLNVRICYSNETLLALRSPGEISRKLSHTLKEIGILKHYRGKRAGVKQRCRPWDINNGLRFANLRYPKITKCHHKKMPKSITLGLVNVRSIKNKCQIFQDYLVQNSIDICVITETWLRVKDSATRSACLPPAYNINDFPRQNRTGGGVGVVYREDLFEVRRVKAGEESSFEYTQWVAKHKDIKVNLVSIYRPPYSAVHPISVNIFLQELENYLDKILDSSEPVIICGDLNIHVNNVNDHSANKFNDICQSRNLTQHVSVPTHTSGNTLDLIITRDDNRLSITPPVSGHYISDHCFVITHLSNINRHIEENTVTFRQYKKINKEAFRNDILNSSLCDHALLNNSENTALTDGFRSRIVDTHLNKFTPLKPDEIKKYIIKSPTKQCQSDPIPTWLLKEYVNILLPIITCMTNRSLQIGTFPAVWKEATVIPLIKKTGGGTELSNYRPVSNLPFISKLVERVVADQLTKHMQINAPLPIHQSAYRQHHSTETVLGKVVSDILECMGRKEVALLVLLDLSAAFDTVDHNILIDIMQKEFGIQNVALDWLSSYLVNRSQRVLISGSTSESVQMKFGVPQGSCLGPVLFTAYSSTLFHVINKHMITSHGYADDTQLVKMFKPRISDQTEVTMCIERCIRDIQSWMTTHRLKLNDSKTEVMILGTPQQLAKTTIEHIAVGNDQIQVVDHVRNLGGWLDSNLSMDRHVNQICKKVNHNLHNIHQIRKYLNQSATETLVHSLITSHLDYANTIMFGMSQYLFDRLQRVQNNAARVVKGLRKYDSISKTLIELHWLPVKARVDFKVILTVFKALNNAAPVYIRDMFVRPDKPRYNLRKNSVRNLVIPRSYNKINDRALAIAGPRLWNSIPDDLKDLSELEHFKRKLKTHLFKMYHEL